MIWQLPEILNNVICRNIIGEFFLSAVRVHRRGVAFAALWNFPVLQMEQTRRVDTAQSLHLAVL